MKDLFQKMKMAADTNSSVLLIGESGTGKELIASALHQNSIRKEHKIVKINCAAIPGDLLESELFGYAKGAFTGANEDKKGKFLIAHKGTLFLDEISEMDVRLQAKLLRFLQEKEFSPLGSNKVINVDVRIIAATNANLENLIDKKRFREDLYYRLNVITFQIPSLRERQDDLPLLVQYFINKIAKENNKKITNVSPAVFTKLENYHFPGNIRELENMLERAIVLSTGPIIEIDDLPPTRTQVPTESKKESNVLSDHVLKRPDELEVKNFETEKFIKEWIKQELTTLNEGQYREKIISHVERELILHVLKKNLFNKSKTAKSLGINRMTLDKKITEYDIISEITD